MKKILVLSLFLVIAFTLPVFAGPFVDVPEGHWAYEAIQKMADRGFIEGYPDGTFQGKKPITRYEMAIIIARLVDSLEAKIGALKSVSAPAKEEGPKVELPTDLVKQKELQDLKNTVQKLAAEFQDELQALGVRISNLEERVTALEKKEQKVKVSGEIRARSWTNIYPKEVENETSYYQRTRLNVSADYGDTKAEVQYKLHTAGGEYKANKDSVLEIAKATVNTKLGTIIVGRQYFTLGMGLLACADANVGAIAATNKGGVDAAIWTKDFGRVSLLAAGATLDDSSDGVNDAYAVARAEIKLGEKGTLGVNYLYKGAKSIEKGYSADIKLGPVSAEYASYEPTKDADRVKAVVVSADVLKTEKLTLNISGAQIDEDFAPGVSVVNSAEGKEEDVSPVYVSGFKGVAVKGTLKVTEKTTLVGEVAKSKRDDLTGLYNLGGGKEKGRAGLVRAGVVSQVTENATISVMVEQVGKEKKPPRYLRGELKVKF